MFTRIDHNYEYARQIDLDIVVKYREREVRSWNELARAESMDSEFLIGKKLAEHGQSAHGLELGDHVPRA